MHGGICRNITVMPRGLEQEGRQCSCCHTSQYEAQGHSVSGRMDSGRDGSWKLTDLHLHSPRDVIKMTQQAHNPQRRWPCHLPGFCWDDFNKLATYLTFMSLTKKNQPSGCHMLAILSVLGEEWCFPLISDHDLESLGEGHWSLPVKIRVHLKFIYIHIIQDAVLPIMDIWHHSLP